jgi:hypothetical protein
LFFLLFSCSSCCACFALSYYSPCTFDPLIFLPLPCREIFL